MVKDLRGAVHLAQDNNHLIIDELLELPQVANHLHLQLCANLKGKVIHIIDVNLKIDWYYLKHQDCVGFYLVAYNMHNGCLYLFRSNVLQVFLHHDLSQTGLNQSLGALSLSWPVYMKPRIINHPVWSQCEVCLTSYDYLYGCGFCEAILKQYHKDIKTKLLFDLNKQFEIKSQLVVVRANGKGALSLGLWCWVYHGTSVSSLIATQALIGSQGTELFS